MSKFFDEKIKEMELQIATISRMVAPGQVVNFDEYRRNRINLNIPVLEAIFGAKIDGTKIKFDKPLPSIGEVYKIFDIMNRFYNDIEQPLMQKFAVASVDPDSDEMPNMINEEIPKFNKIKVKDVKNAIIGNGKVAFPMISMLFTPVQIIEMASLSEDLRRIIHRNTMLIIGGVTLVATAATVTGICIYKHHKKKKLQQNESTTVETDDLDGNNADGFDTDMPEDIPVVDLDLV